MRVSIYYRLRIQQDQQVTNRPLHCVTPNANVRKLNTLLNNYAIRFAEVRTDHSYNLFEVRLIMTCALALDADVIVEPLFGWPEGEKEKPNRSAD